jgi:ribosomal protein S18 acetylase RimI-like enzyme
VKVLIRDAVPGDMTVLRGVFRRSSLSNDGDRPNLLAHPEVLELPDRAVREGRTRAAVAGGAIVGFASWLGAGDAIEIEDLFVEPECMRQGIGRTLVLDLIAIARSRGIGRVEVTANQHALAFYEQAGFVVYREDATRFGPAPRMQLDITS